MKFVSKFIPPANGYKYGKDIHPNHVKCNVTEYGDKKKTIPVPQEIRCKLNERKRLMKIIFDKMYMDTCACS